MSERSDGHGAEHIFEDAGHLASDLEEAWADAREQIQEQLEERPYLTLGAAALAGYALGGGLATRLTAVALGLGARFAFSALMRQAAVAATASPAPKEPQP